MAKADAGGADLSAMKVTVIGAGVAGLAAACTLVERGAQVVLHEAAPAAGGRCRSYFDPALNCRIDNGNHLLLSGNHAVMAFLNRIGAADTLAGPEDPVFAFVDVKTKIHWKLRLNRGRLPWWVFAPNRRVPGTKAVDYLALLKLRRAGVDDLVAPMLAGAGTLYRNLLEPLAIAALNTPPDVASAAPLRAVVAETIERGGAASIPRFPRVGLSESFIDPALAWLAARGAEVRLGSRVSAVVAGEKTILAVPPWVAVELLPGLVVPCEHQAILNLHFKCQIDPGETGFWGLVGGVAEWAFAKGEILSVTVSAANKYAQMDNATLAALVWADLRAAFGLAEAMPSHRVVREKRATFAATPAQLKLRPGTRTADNNIMLAGDWTDTGLPATIEGAIRSGNAAAMAMLEQHAC
ncbi:MAG: hydroxysqualene dehydroxylase HpnE [Acidocella sp.]|nr:hydroxysqualene dehydroxylase HpnE [Acidocella sp.]